MPKAYIYALLTVFMWSTIATAFKLSLGVLDPFQLLLYASLTSLTFMLSVLVMQQRLSDLLHTLKKRWPLWLLLGSLNPFLYHILLFSAYDRLPAQQALALNYTWPMALTLLSAPILGHHIRKIDVLAIGLAYLGVLVIATRGNLTALQFDDGPGVIMALASTICWALYWLLSARQKEDPVVSLTATFIVSLPLIMATVYFQSSFLPEQWQDLSGAIYVGLIEMGLAYICWMMALKHASNTASVSNLSYLSPLLSLFVIWLVLGEPIISATWTGLGLILGGILLQKVTLQRPETQ